MPLTVTNQTGDGITVDFLESSLTLPDSGTSVLITGRVVPVATGLSVSITGSPLVIPSAPGSGSIFYNVQVNTSTGAATVAQSTSADPAAAAGCDVVFRQTLVPGSTDPATVGDSTPDNW